MFTTCLHHFTTVFIHISSYPHFSSAWKPHHSKKKMPSTRSTGHTDTWAKESGVLNFALDPQPEKRTFQSQRLWVVSKFLTFLEVQ